MDLKAFNLLLIVSTLVAHARAESVSGSVLFLDSPSHGFLRSPAPAQGEPMSVSDIGAAVSVLLGFAPSHAMSTSTASKLNEVLSPNPFNRPRAVFLLEVSGVDMNRFHSKFGVAVNRRVNIGGIIGSIQLPARSDSTDRECGHGALPGCFVDAGVDEASMIMLDEPQTNSAWTDKHVADFASSMGGSYVVDTVDPLSGEVTIPSDNGVELKLQLSQKADKEFTLSLVTLMHNVKKAMMSHEEATNNGQNPAELLMGSFNGIKAIKEKYSVEEVAQKRMDLFISTTSKLFSSMLENYKGKIAGVVLFNEAASVEPVSMFDVAYTSRSSARWLEEVEATSDPMAIARVLLVRQTLAWMTGIILLIATLLGVYFLSSMPLTRDTLLNSNVKFD